MHTITVTRTDSNDENYTFRVVVAAEGRTTEHTVLVDPAYHIALSGGVIPPEELVRMSLEFLLVHEPAEAILPAFDLAMITEYFPSYEHDISQKIHDISS